MAGPNRLKIARLSADFPIGNLNDASWSIAPEIVISRYWSGTDAPTGRCFRARLLWSNMYLYVRFDANQTEPLVVGLKPDLSTKTVGLWERDVCEIFIAPDRDQPNKYFEFEIAPTGEWLDIAIEKTPHERLTAWDYRSEIESVAEIDELSVVMAVKVPFTAFGKNAKAGDIWLGNLFRCVGAAPHRGYLAWQPTMTPEPAFHVPERFGWFEFEPLLERD